MADQRVIDYLKQNSGSYPVETLKQALIQQGFSEADIDVAVGEAGLGGPPPAPSVSGESTPGADAVDMRAGNVFSNAKWMVKDPAGYFDALPNNAKIGPSLGTTLIWSLIAGGVFAIVGIVAQSGVHRIAAISQIVLFPMMSLIFGFVGAGIYHVICKIIGGNGQYGGSYAILASIAALFPLSALFSLIPYGGIPLQIYGLFLSVSGAVGVHKVAKTKAWIAFGLLAVFGVVGSIAAQRQAKELQKILEQMGPPGQLPGQGGIPTGVPGNMQDLMQQVTENPNAILQDMARYQAMRQPPSETLALLDSEGQSSLKEAWEKMAAPIRVSVVQNIPEMDPEDRTGFINQMVAATANMNEMLNGSMEMLQKLQLQQGGGQ